MMELYFIIIGMICLSYYGIIRLYTGKWNSTFAGFWIIAGMMHVICFFIWEKLPNMICNLGTLFLVVFWVTFLAVQIKIIWKMNQKPEEHASYMVVLGAHVNGTKITNSLRRRLDAAEEYLKRNPDTVAILSGGQGRGEEISEAHAMECYLLKKGISKRRLILEDQSTTTEQNLKFSKKLIDQSKAKEQKTEEFVVIVSNNFHIYRALLLAKRSGYVYTSGLPASSNPILQVNYLVREFFALILTLIRPWFRR